MSLINIEESKRLNSKFYNFSGFYFKRWNIEETKTGFIVYNDMTGNAATINNKFLNEFYSGEKMIDKLIGLVRQSLKDLPAFKETTDPDLIAKIDRFSSGFLRFQKEIKSAFELVNYSYVCLFEQELPIKGSL